ncbi:MAG: NADH-quinone oxidoreductase subunit K [Defluviitaleaceae bacterium]|nr:NADH-quinone oxidoreductase subunit K [Defluviitaleaceae bacterium]
MEFISIALFFIALFGLITSKNIIKSIIFIMVKQTAVGMFWLQISAGDLPLPPIIYDTDLLAEIEVMADPLPQTLTLTAIIIGFSVIAIIITMLNNLFRQHNTTDWKTIEMLQKNI